MFEGQFDLEGQGQQFQTCLRPLNKQFKLEGKVSVLTNSSNFFTKISLKANLTSKIKVKFPNPSETFRCSINISS